MKNYITLCLCYSALLILSCSSLKDNPSSFMNNNNNNLKAINSIMVKNSIILGSSLCLLMLNGGHLTAANAAAIYLDERLNIAAAIPSSQYHTSSSFQLSISSLSPSTPSPISSMIVASNNEFLDQLIALKKVQDIQQVLDAADVEFTSLPLGASYREFRVGTGNSIIKPGSTVSVEMTIRCKKLATAKEPGGVKYYDTKLDTKNNLYTWTIGSGQLPPALEEAIVGMKRNAIRRVELPSTLVFKARKDNQLPLPNEKNNADGSRRYKQLFKTDATLLFEVLVVSIKDV